MLELAHALLPPSTVELILSGKYADVSDPKARLTAMTENLTLRAQGVVLAGLERRLTDAKRKGDQDLVRQLLAEIVSTRKQVD